ncbi:MAG: site-specific integrase [Firmicutes bacterium]|nr:site-specific integrase [Bacillota bacterium]
MKGHVRKHGDGWQGVVYQGRGPDGKKRYKYLPVAQTQKQAQRMVNDIIAEMNKGTYIEPTRQTVAEWCREWLELYTRGVSEGTRVWYKDVIERLIAPAIGGIPLAKLTASDVQRWLNNELDQGYAPDTVHGHYRVLRAALLKATRMRKLAVNPLLEVEPPARKREAGKAITAEQAEAFLAAVREHAPYRYTLYLTAMTMGMRRGEILGLRWSDVDFARGMINVRQQLHKSSTVANPKFKEVKTKHGRRDLPMPRMLAEALAIYKVEQDMIKQALGKSYNPYNLVFTTSKGTPIMPCDLTRQYKSLLKKAGVPEIRLHDLRHTNTTWLLEAGVSPNEVARFAGHADPAFTVQKYGHTLEDHLTRPARVIDEILRKKIGG